MESAVKGVRRTFISTLDSTLHRNTLELGTKLNTFLFSFVPYWRTHRSCLSSVHYQDENVRSTLPGFYPHSEWAALRPVHVGVRLAASQARHCWRAWVVGCCYLWGDLVGPAGYSQSPEQGVGCNFHLRVKKNYLARSRTSSTSMTKLLQFEQSVHEKRCATVHIPLH